MSAQNGRRLGFMRIAFAYLLNIIGLVITGSAGIIVFAAAPYVLLDRWHLLPAWANFWILFVPIVVAWDHAGFYLVLTVTACELTLVLLKPELRKTKIVAACSAGLCIFAYLLLYVANRFNFH